jgi:hypothetical protein
MLPDFGTVEAANLPSRASSFPARSDYALAQKRNRTRECSFGRCQRKGSAMPVK